MTPYFIAAWWWPLRVCALAQKSGIKVVWPDGHPFHGRKRIAPDGRVI